MRNALAIFWLAATVAHEPLSPAGTALEIDDACIDGESSCALSLAQFRARRRSSTKQAHNVRTDAYDISDHAKIADVSTASAENATVFIAYLSAPGNFARRQRVRELCFEAIAATGSQVKFFVGRPSDPSIWPATKEQNLFATNWEVATSNKLIDEADEHGDIVIVPMRDYYRDLSDKDASAFLHVLGLSPQPDFIMKIDDDMCPDMRKLLASASKLPENEARYVGANLNAGSGAYDPNYNAVDYMTGACYALSRNLAHMIFVDDRAHTLLYASYGSSAEDANMGRWFQHESERLQGSNVTFTRVVAHDLCTGTER